MIYEGMLISMNSADLDAESHLSEQCKVQMLECIDLGVKTSQERSKFLLEIPLIGMFSIRV